MATPTTAELLARIAQQEQRIQALEHDLGVRARESVVQRALIEQVVDALPFTLYVVDRDYRIHLWNRTRELGLEGVSRADALGRTIFDVMPRQPATVLRREFDEVFTSGNILQFQMESDAFGATRTFRISKIPMALGGAQVSHVITVGEDITDWREALERVAQSDKLAALGQLAAGVMHEINNPLATIAACAESMAVHRDLAAALPPGAAVPGPPPDEMVRIIDLEVQRCKRIVDGLLDFSRPKPTRREPLPINAVVQRTTFLLQHHPRSRHVRILPELDQTRPLFVEGDEDQLVQVLLALAMNALDVTPEDGQITIRTYPQDKGGGRVVVDVIDAGPGIPRALQAKVFEPFFTTKPVGQGTGLGLAICHGIVTDHAGSLELDSVEGQGATFRVVLPEATLRPTAVA